MQKEVKTNGRKMSNQMKAVLTILSSDRELMDAAGKHVDWINESICWEPILKIAWGSGHRAALSYAYGIWRDEIRPQSNPFEDALNMDLHLRRAVIRALAIRWGLQAGLEVPNEKTYSEGGAV